MAVACPKEKRHEIRDVPSWPDLQSDSDSTLVTPIRFMKADRRSNRPAAAATPRISSAIRNDFSPLAQMFSTAWLSSSPQETCHFRVGQ